MLIIIFFYLFKYVFFRDMVFIQGMEDDMLIIASLVKPRKITLKGSDGKKYMILCKPKVSFFFENKFCFKPNLFLIIFLQFANKILY